jgi:ATP-dependent Lhr-like helicase
MFKILSEGDYRISVGNQKIDFIDTKAKALFGEAIDYFNHSNLKSISILQHGNSTCIFTWMGDKVVNTLVALLTQKGFVAGAYAGLIEVEKSNAESIVSCIKELSKQCTPSNTELAKLVVEKKIEKYDEFLPEELLNVGYGCRAFDVEATYKWLKIHC